MSAAKHLNYYPPLLSVAFPRTYTVEEYLEIEAQSEHKLDYVNGYIVKAEMGGTYTHANIGGNIFSALKTALKGKPCRVFNGDLRIKAKKNFRFPDGLVVCGEPKFHNTKKTTLTNPSVLIEIVSSESRKRDYVDKRSEYFEIESLQHYIVIEQERPFVSVFSKNSDGLHLFADYDFENPSILLEGLGIVLNLEDIYDDVEFG
jgi:Uma2 family endonuclease